MDWQTISSFSKVPDMRNPLEDTFASQIYQGWDGRQGTWESLLPEERERWREKARRYGQGDDSCAPWRRKLADVGKPSVVPAWI